MEVEATDVGPLVALLADEMAGVVDRAARRALADIPEYAARLSAEDLAEGIARDLGLAMAALTEGRPFTAEDRSVTTLIGDSRARQGLPVEGMVRVYRITVDEVFAVIAGAAQDGRVAPDAALALMRSAWSYAGPMIEGAVGAYRERELELAVADSRRRTELVISLLLSDRGASAGLVSAVGLDPSGTYVAFRARGAGDERALLRALETPGVLDRGLVAPYEGDVIGLAAARPVTATDAGVAIGVGPAGRLDDLPRSFVVASRVVDTAWAFGHRGVLTIEDLALESVVRSEHLLGDVLLGRYVAPLDPASAAGAEVLQTVAAFLDADLSAEDAAQALGVHPNTVRNRLRRFEQATGASLRSVRDLAEIRLALLRAAIP